MKQKQIRRSMFVVAAVVLSAALLADILIDLKIIQVVFTVPDDFQASVFSGILTFSTLSLTVLSMIIGMMDLRISGLKLREILALDASPIRFSAYLFFSTVLSLLSIMALAFERYTLMTAIAVCSLLYTMSASVIVFKIMSDIQMTLKIIQEEDELRDGQFFPQCAYRWLEEYKQALISYNVEDLNIYSALLEKCAMTEAVSDLIQRQLPDLLELAGDRMPFAEALSWVFKKTGMKRYEEEICKYYSGKIRFFDGYQLLRFDIPGKLNSLINAQNERLTVFAADLCYLLLDPLIDNEAAGDVRNEVLDECLKIITSFQKIPDQKDVEQGGDAVKELVRYFNELRIERTSQIRKVTILRLFLEKVLLHPGPVSDMVYEKLLHYLHIGLDIDPDAREIRTGDRICLETIACMYQGCYMAAERNWKDEKKRERVISVVTKHGLESLWNQVSRNDTRILSYYVDNAMDKDRIATYVYYRAHKADANAYSPIEPIGFAYRFYLASDIVALGDEANIPPELRNAESLKRYKGYRFPLLDKLPDKLPDKLTDKEESNLWKYERFLKEFDPQTEMIKEACMKDVLMIQRMNGNQNPLKESILWYEERSIRPVFQAVHQAVQNMKQRKSE